MKQTAKRRERNVSIKRDIKSAVKAFTAKPSSETLSAAQSEIDTAVKKKLLNKAKGQKVPALFSDMKMIKQIFSPATVASYQQMDNEYKTEMVKRYTKIPWGDLFEDYIYPESGNSDISKVVLKFKKNVPSEYFSSNEKGDENPLSTNMVNVWILTADATEMRNYIKQLYALKEKKPESKFNEQIRKFSKTETIKWLKESLVFKGGLIDRDIKIVSIDECKIVLTYAAAYKYEAEIPTNIKSIDKYGTLEYDKEVASVRILNPDRFNDGQKKYAKTSALFIPTTNEELMENIECALKHLAGFCK